MGVNMNIKIIVITGLIVLSIIIYCYIQISHFIVKKPIFYSNKLSNDIRITQISDYHGNKNINFGVLINKVIEFNPHIIALTGDIIDGKSKDKDMEYSLDLINRLTEINKDIFFVAGNHELKSLYGDEFIYKIKDMGIMTLDNKYINIDIEENSINILGLEFFAFKSDYEEIIAKVNPQNYTILLSHAPNRAISYSLGLEDLILSGHTHGGQIRLPFIGAIVAPGQGLLPKYDKGVFDLDDTILYIDSGLGNSILPIRFFNPVQISNITIKPKNNYNVIFST